MLITNESKKRIFILEGADKLGKSTHAKAISDMYKIKLVKQPNADNTLGYLRQDLKYDSDIDITVRQMFHGFQNSVDIFEFPKDDVVIMDRCYLSNIVYSTVLGVRADVVDMMVRMNKTIWEKYLSEYDITLVCLVGAKPFKKANEEDVYESADKWKELNNAYIKELVDHEEGNDLFPLNVKCKILDVSIMTEQDVFMHLLSTYFTPSVGYINEIDTRCNPDAKCNNTKCIHYIDAHGERDNNCFCFDDINECPAVKI